MSPSTPLPALASPAASTPHSTLAPALAPTLVLERVRVAYGKVEAVRGVSLAVPPGTIVTVIGANGAGKTTLLHAAMGILPATGAMTFEGTVLGDHAIEERVAMGLALVPERRELFGSMAVEDNLALGGFRATASERWRRMDEVYVRFPRLQERRRQLAGTLSGGERQMLAMGRALMGQPRLLMLDEPSLGLAPLIVRDIFEMILGLKKTGVSILLVEQNARAALQAADYAYVMELGLITAEGPAAELASNPLIIESYLGLPGQVLPGSPAGAPDISAR
jgi:branched-chain amino acid transport system ATP-binding protein